MGNFVRRTGKSHYKEYTASGAITAGDAVQFDENGEVAAAATNKAIVGIALAAATTNSTCKVDVVDSGSEWEMPIEAGTMATSEVGEEADLNSADGLTLTESNNDVCITGWDGATTSKCYGVFKKLAFGETTAA